MLRKQKGVRCSITHSTSVVELAAKPVVDIDLIIESNKFYNLICQTFKIKL